MSDEVMDPLFGEAPTEVALERAPLVRVLAQVAFDPIFILRNEDTIAPFQNGIRGTYPKASHETLRLPPQLVGDAEGRTEVTWRFLSSDSAWRVSVTPTFMTVETVKYVSRADLLARIRDLVTALKSAVGTLHVGRIGLRYVDQVKGPEMERLHELVRPEMLGIARSPLTASIRHSVTETYCDTAEGGIIARWGSVPAHGTHEPNIMLPVPEPSWFLDIDAFAVPSEQSVDMAPEAICEAARALAQRSYSFFRWAVTERFLEVYGRRS
jgi:uncharacterized protein (TIGR04255 family)